MVLIYFIQEKSRSRPTPRSKTERCAETEAASQAFAAHTPKPPFARDPGFVIGDESHNASGSSSLGEDELLMPDTSGDSDHSKSGQHHFVMSDSEDDQRHPPSPESDNLDSPPLMSDSDEAEHPAPERPLSGLKYGNLASPEQLQVDADVDFVMSDSDIGNLGGSALLMPDSDRSVADGNVSHDQDDLIMSDSQSEQSAPGSSASLGRASHDPEQLTTGLANLPDLNDDALVMPDSDEEGEKILRLAQIEAMSGSKLSTMHTNIY